MARPKRRARWAGNKEIASVLDVLTAACSFCGGAAKVPEDVVLVVAEKDGHKPIVCCPDCTPTLAATLDRIARERNG